MQASEEIYMEGKTLSLSKIDEMFQKSLSFSLDSGDHYPSNFQFSIESKTDDKMLRESGHYMMKLQGDNTTETDQIAFYDRIAII